MNSGNITTYKKKNLGIIKGKQNLSKYNTFTKTIYVLLSNLMLITQRI